MSIQGITEQDIANYLANTPGFFERNAELLSAIHLTSPHGQRAVSLQERQMEMLRDKIKALERQIVEMIRHGQDNVAIADRLAAAGSPISSDDALTRLPRGFEAAKGTPVADYVCWKSFTAHAALSDKDMQSPAVVDRIVDFARLALPLLEWGWEAGEDDMPPLVLAMPARRLPPPDF